MIRVDFHTHSTASPDGGITAEQYQALFDQDIVDCIAITDHDTVEMAVHLRAELGERIIIGEEISTQQGDIVGLFLTQAVPGGLSLSEAIKAIKAQGGVVYLPHPFETVRKGVQETDLEGLIDQIDIVEVYNGRALAQNKGPEATVWARLHQIPSVASSDAHGARGVGTAYTIVDQMPTAHNLMKLLQTARLTMERPPLKSLLYPKMHRLRRAIKRGKV